MPHLPRFQSEFETLEIAVHNAGSALACSFSSSAEFEAATIEAKRAAGIYGPKRRRRHAAWMACGIIIVALVMIALIP
jgi:hypothetical protein